MNTFNSMTNLSIVDTTEGEFFDMYNDDFAGALAVEADVAFCDGDNACCCCCCCCC